jgi:hypothetical protein
VNGMVIQQILCVEYICLSGMTAENTTIKLLEGGRTLRVSFELPAILFDQDYVDVTAIGQPEILPRVKIINEAPGFFSRISTFASFVAK